MQTISGIKVDLNNFGPHHVRIRDIATSLSQTNRFNGHIQRPFSVAEHSIIGCRLADDEHKLELLLHDTAEAYTGDLILPMKELFPEIAEFEDKLQAIILNELYPTNQLVHDGKYAKSNYCIQLDRKMAKWESLFLRPKLQFEQDTWDTRNTWLDEYMGLHFEVFAKDKDALINIFLDEYEKCWKESK